MEMISGDKTGYVKNFSQEKNNVHKIYKMDFGFKY